MFRTAVAAALVASALAAAQHEGLIDRVGLLGSCTPVSAAAPDGSQWLECRRGELTGYPDLSRDSCRRGALRGEVRYWLCPTTLVAARSTAELPTR
jgi:hypothetical protein